MKTIQHNSTNVVKSLINELSIFQSSIPTGLSLFRTFRPSHRILRTRTPCEGSHGGEKLPRLREGMIPHFTWLDPLKKRKERNNYKDGDVDYDSARRGNRVIICISIFWKKLYEIFKKNHFIIKVLQVLYRLANSQVSTKKMGNLSLA